jgi:hypothetical protein
MVICSHFTASGAKLRVWPVGRDAHILTLLLINMMLEVFKLEGYAGLTRAYS